MNKKEYYLKNRDRILARKKIYVANNKDKIQQYRYNVYIKNKETICARNRRRYRINKIKIPVLTTEYLQTHRTEKIVDYHEYNRQFKFILKTVVDMITGKTYLSGKLYHPPFSNRGYNNLVD